MAGRKILNLAIEVRPLALESDNGSVAQLERALRYERSNLGVRVLPESPFADIAQLASAPVL